MAHQNARDEMRERAADSALKNIVFLLEGSKENPEAYASRNMDQELSGDKLVELLNSNFAKVDLNNNGISRQELLAALTAPNVFTVNEYAMLKLVAKYFDTIINLSDDEPGAETVLTHTDVQVLAQFLVNSKIKLSELHRWIALSEGTAATTERDVGPPPLSHHG